MRLGRKAILAGLRADRAKTGFWNADAQRRCADWLAILCPDRYVLLGLGFPAGRI